MQAPIFVLLRLNRGVGCLNRGLHRLARIDADYIDDAN